MKTLLNLLIIPLFLGLTGCSFEDEDRCPAGYEYDEEVKACRPLAPDGGGEAKDGAAADGSGGDIGGAGFGDPCTEHGDCVTDADYCTYNDITKSGMCTYQDCTADSCPEGYLCCDCTAVGQAVICVPDNEPMVEQFCQCMTKTP